MYLTRTPILFLALAFSFALPCFAQEEPFEKFLRHEQESNEAAENWLQELLDTPLDLNRINAAELQRFPFLSFVQINAFLAQRQNTIYFSTLEAALHALQVRGDTLTFCRVIFTTRPPPALRARKIWRAALRSRSGVPATLEANWLGAKYRMYHRARGEYGALHFGALTERDPGELQWDDHRVWYVDWEPARSRVVLGNFQTEWGLGLAQWGPYAATVTSEVHALSRRWGRGIVPYLSANENAMYHGIAVAHELRHWTALAFISSATRDVTLREAQFAVGYRTSGYHRTASENVQRDNLRERARGGALSYHFGVGRELGLLYYAETFNRLWQAADRRASYFDFAGTRNEVLSLAGAWQRQQQALSFEIARSRSKAKAAAFTLSAQERGLGLSLALFHVERGFHSPHSRSFTESDAPAQAASGYALGLTLQLRSRVHGEFFYQHERRLWQANVLPPRARRAGAQIEWHILSDLRLLLRYSFAESDQLQTVFESPLQIKSRSHRLRCELEQSLSRRLRFRPRLDFIRSGNAAFAEVLEPSHGAPGTALSLDILYQPSEKVTLNFRQTHFDTDQPLYHYERDLPGVFTVVALRERGLRRYIYGHLKLHPNLSLAGKISLGESERAQLAWGLQLDWTIK